jgi:hypothetical protein
MRGWEYIREEYLESNITFCEKKRLSEFQKPADYIGDEKNVKTFFILRAVSVHLLSSYQYPEGVQRAVMNSFAHRYLLYMY